MHFLSIFSFPRTIALSGLMESHPMCAQIRIQLKYLGEPMQISGALSPSCSLLLVCATNFSPLSFSKLWALFLQPSKTTMLCWGSPFYTTCSKCYQVEIWSNHRTYLVFFLFCQAPQSYTSNCPVFENSCFIYVV